MNYEIMRMIKSKFSSNLTIFSRLSLKKRSKSIKRKNKKRVSNKFHCLEFSIIFMILVN